jgi:putative solute:sodium symporter small subunit
MKTWSKNKRLIAILLSIWFVTTLLVGLAPEALRFNFFGWNFTYWWGAQGSLLIYLAIAWIYAHKMHQYEKKVIKTSRSNLALTLKMERSMN